MITNARINRIRGRIAELGIRQADLAAQVGMNETLLNAVLRGRRPLDARLEEKLHAQLDLLERVKRAGQEAEARALAHELGHSSLYPQPGCQWCRQPVKSGATSRERPDRALRREE